MAKNSFFNFVAQLGGVARDAGPVLQAQVKAGRQIANQAAGAITQAARGETGTATPMPDSAATGKPTRASGKATVSAPGVGSRLGLRLRVLADQAIGDSTRWVGSRLDTAVQQSTREARSSLSLARGFLRTNMDVFVQKLDPRLGPTNTMLQQVVLEAQRKGVLALSALAAAAQELEDLQPLCAQDSDADLTVQLEPLKALIARAKAIVDKVPTSEEVLAIRYAELDTALGELQEDVQIYPARLRTFADQFGPQQMLDVEIWRQLQDRFVALDLDSEEPSETSEVDPNSQVSGNRLTQFCDLEADVEVALSRYRGELQRFDQELQRLADLKDLFRIQVDEATEQLERYPHLKDPMSRFLKAVENKPVDLAAADVALQELCGALNALA
jgi:hypothetical protein